MSDKEYLLSKVAQTGNTMEESDEEEDGAGGDDEDCGPVHHTDSAYESGERENLAKTKVSVFSEDRNQKQRCKQEVSFQTDLWKIEMFLFCAARPFLLVCMC